MHGTDIDALHQNAPYPIAHGSKQSFQFQRWPETAALLVEQRTISPESQRAYKASMQLASCSWEGIPEPEADGPAGQSRCDWRSLLRPVAPAAEFHSLCRSIDHLIPGNRTLQLRTDCSRSQSGTVRPASP